jgi:hypothetical protein
MSEVSTTTWSQEEFKAYLLIYAADSNHEVSKEEVEFIESRFNKDLLKKINKEIKDDNDYQRIQKVLANIKQNDYSQEDLDKLLKEIKELYMTDGMSDIVEQTTFLFLKKMLST